MEILTTNHYDRIKELFKDSKCKIRIMSPYLSKSLAENLCELVKEKRIECQFITRIYLEDLYVKANNIDAIELMVKSGIQVYALKFLHTKLYIFDDDRAVVGSANFTASGFKSNIELSLLADGKTEEQSLELISELKQYFDDTISKIQDGLVTDEMISKVRTDYKDIIIPQKKASQSTDFNYNTKMYGSVIENKKKTETEEEIKKEVLSATKEKDIINEIFSSNEPRKQIIYDHVIWMKQMGRGNDRIDENTPFYPTKVILNGKEVYISTYSESWRPSAVNDGDEIYLAALSQNNGGQNVPIIIGRGYLRKFSEQNRYKEEWLSEHPWIEKYPWYCIIEKCEILKTMVKNGISMDIVWDNLGSDTYEASFGKCETIDKVSKKHYQKAHIKLSGNAKEFIDEQFNRLSEQYGVDYYFSEK
ncbi:phospholipase D-like domain-containing protein [uncultured Ruminococcus sp.]|uniref:phospholipase D-like domain-containing protein n=1 Tax=uncultured Ruminococcus sp. TaxID=165186 RepID=UPI0025F6C7C0|nr:phospholipase D-like domain-containing protein [uncultured Ruminococcus sp.]